MVKKIIRRTSKKAQFGPDALIGIVLVAVLGLGGIFFLNLFVNGVALQGLVSILDTEFDQRCFFVLLPMLGDDYIREGRFEMRGDIVSSAGNLQGFSHRFVDTKLYYGGHVDAEYTSDEFNNTIYIFNRDISAAGRSFPKTIENLTGFMASDEKSNEIKSRINQNDFSTQCSVPVYNPTGPLGSAHIFMRESGEEQ